MAVTSTTCVADLSPFVISIASTTVPYTYLAGVVIPLYVPSHICSQADTHSILPHLDQSGVSLTSFIIHMLTDPGWRPLQSR